MIEPAYRCEIYRDRAGEWRWRWWAGNNRIVAESGEGYSSRNAAWQAADRARRAEVRFPARRLLRVARTPQPLFAISPRPGRGR